MKRKFISILLIAAVSAFGFGLSAYAQDAAPAADAPADAKKEDVQKFKGKTLGDYWAAGGLTMYPLGFCAIAGIALIIYNFISIRPVKFMAPKDVDALSESLNGQKIEDAIAYCEKTPSPLTNIVGAGLARINENEVDYTLIEEAMQEASVEELSSPYVMVNYLALIASISPMLGLFGTVTGMVKAFDTIAAEGAGSAQKLADNISEALITTATGMIIGIPAMFFYFLFKNKYGKVTSGISRVVGELLYIFRISHKFGPQEISSDASSDAPAIEAPQS